MSMPRESCDGKGILQRPWWFEPRSLIVSLCCTALLAASGCTTMQPIEPTTAAGTSQQLEPGETVAVSLRDGSRLELSFVDWTAAGLAGTDSNGELHRIDSEDIAQLEVKRHSLLGSIGVGVVILAVVLAAAGDSSGY